MGTVAVWYVLRPERLFIDEVVDEAFRSVQATAVEPVKPIRSGQFHDVAHETQGPAAIYESASGGRILRLTGFETSTGPDLHVYLIAATDADDHDTVM